MPRVKRLLRVLVGLLGLLSVMAHADEPANHYIVLFDASGSVKRAYRPPYNFWQGNVNDSRFMAQRLSKLVNKALREPPRDSGFDFPPIKNSDLFSFLLFRLEYERPSYQLPHMFMTNEWLLLHQGLPSVGAYQSFNFLSASGERGSKDLAEALSGFSPLIAATTAALPFIGWAIPAQNQLIRRTFIVRITDGS